MGDQNHDEPQAPRTVRVEEVMPMYQLSNQVARGAQSLIDACLARGAIKGEELNAVSELRSACIKISAMCENFHSENS